MFAYLISYSVEENSIFLFYPCKEGALGLGVKKVGTLLYMFPDSLYLID